MLLPPLAERGIASAWGDSEAGTSENGGGPRRLELVGSEAVNILFVHANYSSRVTLSEIEAAQPLVSALVALGVS